MRKPKEIIYTGTVIQAEITYITERDTENYPMLYENEEPGNIKKVWIEEIIINCLEENPIGALEDAKTDIENLILKLKKEKENGNN